MRVGILGGTGPAGRGLAARLGAAGIDVVIGSRSKERADASCEELAGAWPGRKLQLSGGDNATASAADVVVVATPWDGAAPTVAANAELLAGKVVISMANALTRVGTEFQPLIPPRGSIAAHVAAAAPEAKVAAAFQHLPAKELADLDHEIDSDVLVCADDPEAMATTSKLVHLIPGLRALEAGSLSSAAAVEALTAVILQMNVRYKTRAAVRITGV